MHSPAELSRLFGSAYSMRTAVGKLHYHDSNGDVHEVENKTGGHQGDPFEMIAFAASAHLVLGRILQDFLLAAGAAYADDIYLTVKLSVLLPLLATLNKVVPKDTGMSFNIPKTKILVKDMSAADARRIAKDLIQSNASLSNIQALVDRDDVFVTDGILTVGVPIGTEAFVSNFVTDKCQQISDDIDKLAPLKDGFVHYQLLRFCQATRLQMIGTFITSEGESLKNL
jgi:hypothetical protein